MNGLANKIQAVINTLESLNIPATYDNMNKLLGCLQALAEVRDAINKEVKSDGNDHAE